MKKINVIILLAIILLGGCMKDKVERTYVYTLRTPVFSTHESVIAAIKNQEKVPVKIPGKIYLRGNYIFLNERGKGVHIINNSNPANPVNESFIPILGNEDIAVTGNMLYADCISDIVVLDISNPKEVVLVNRIKNVVQSWQYFAGENRVVTDWIEKDTIVSERLSFVPINGGVWRGDVYYMSNSSSNTGGGSGKGGSMARFTITKKHLYTVTHNNLNVINIQNPKEPSLNNKIGLSWGIETIYPFKDRLFIGSNTGMFIYNIENPAAPKPEGTFSHARVCDPVIADDEFAYVTLRSGNTCAGFINQLDIVDISNFQNPTLFKTYPLSNPHGLDKVDNILYICDGEAGLKIFDAQDKNSLKLLNTVAMGKTFDVICHNNIAIVSTNTGLVQLDITNPANATIISKVNVAGAD